MMASRAGSHVTEAPGSHDNRTCPYDCGTGLRLFPRARQQSQVAPARRLSVDDVFRSICRRSTARALSGAPARCFCRSDCVLYAGPNLPRGDSTRQTCALRNADGSEDRFSTNEWSLKRLGSSQNTNSLVPCNLALDEFQGVVLISPGSSLTSKALICLLPP
jgi:hypothetical protein